MRRDELFLRDILEAASTITAWGFPVTPDQMAQLARDVGESSLFARTGGAPSLALGMAHILAQSDGPN